MDYTYLYIILILSFLIIWIEKSTQQKINAVIIKRKRKEGKIIIMKENLKALLHKQVIIKTISGNEYGVISEVDEKTVVLKDNKDLKTAINNEYIVSVRELQQKKRKKNK